MNRNSLLNLGMTKTQKTLLKCNFFGGAVTVTIFRGLHDTLKTLHYLLTNSAVTSYCNRVSVYKKACLQLLGYRLHFFT